MVSISKELESWKVETRSRVKVSDNFGSFLLFEEKISYMYLIASCTNQFPQIIVSKQIPEHFSCFAIEIAEIIAILDTNCEMPLKSVNWILLPRIPQFLKKLESW